MCPSFQDILNLYLRGLGSNPLWRSSTRSSSTPIRHLRCSTGGSAPLKARWRAFKKIFLLVCKSSSHVWTELWYAGNILIFDNSQIRFRIDVSKSKDKGVTLSWLRGSGGNYKPNLMYIGEVKYWRKIKRTFVSIIKIIEKRRLHQARKIRFRKLIMELWMNQNRQRNTWSEPFGQSVWFGCESCGTKLYCSFRLPEKI